MTKNFVPQTFKIEIQNGDQIIKQFCRIGSPTKKLVLSFMIRGNFKKQRKVLLNHIECIEIYWMTKNFVPQTFKIEIQNGDQIIKQFCRIGSLTKKLVLSSMIRGNFRKQRKVLLNHIECIEIYWMTKNLGRSNFSNRNTEEGTK